MNTTAKPPDLSAFMFDVQDLYEHMTGALSLNICMHLVKGVHETGARVFVPRQTHPFVIGKTEITQIINRVFGGFNTTETLSFNIKFKKEFISDQSFELLYVECYKDNCLSTVEIYMIDKMYRPRKD